MPRIALLLFVSVSVIVGCATEQTTRSTRNRPSTSGPAEPTLLAPESSMVATLQNEAVALSSLYAAEEVQRFLSQAKTLPAVSPIDVWCPADGSRCVPVDDAPAEGGETKTFDESYFYTTRFGSPLSYARPLQLLADEGLPNFRGAKVLDFGYGYIGHLLLLANLGADVHGVEVDPVLPALYRNHTGPRGAGHITLHHGRYPADAALVDEVADGYDLIISKNVLKRGYIHPEREAPKKWLIDLGASDAAFVQTIFDALSPGGRFLIYNISPRPAAADQPYIPWADGRSPFSVETLTAAGFEVVAFDRVDDEHVRAMARALHWDSDMVLDDLFAHYTLVQRPAT